SPARAEIGARTAGAALLTRGRARDELARRPVVATTAAQLEPRQDVGLIAHGTRTVGLRAAVRAHAVAVGARSAAATVDALQRTDGASGRQHDERKHSAHEDDRITRQNPGANSAVMRSGLRTPCPISHSSAAATSAGSPDTTPRCRLATMAWNFMSAF